jgi:septum formation protein
MELILASTSPYRRRLLERLGLPFTCTPPDVHESPLPKETPQAMAGRLAQAKANAVAELHPGALVIGSDQVAELEARALGKPGGFEAASAQLRACSGREVHFHTAVALRCVERDLSLLHVERFNVRFRELGQEEIETYLRREEPYDCAGSFKVEGLGIALFEALDGADPTGLEGLPLIALCRMLREAGLNPVFG